MTLREIFDLEGKLSPSHVQHIRDGLPENANLEDYGKVLTQEISEFEAVMTELFN